MIHNKLPYSEMEYYIEAESSPELSVDITENGEYNVKRYAKANVNVSGGGGPFSNVKVTINGEYQLLDFNGNYTADSYTLACALITVNNKNYSYYSFNEDTSFPNELNILFSEAVAEGVIPQLSIQTSTPKTISVNGDATIVDQSETGAMIYFTGDFTININ